MSELLLDNSFSCTQMATLDVEGLMRLYWRTYLLYRNVAER